MLSAKCVVRGAIGFALGVSLAAQAPRRDGVITGQVVDASGKPVGAAIVEIHGAGLTVNGPQGVNQPRILTSADGRFVFKDLATGTYEIKASKGGYAEGASGRHRPGGDTAAVEITDTARPVDVVVRVWKHGAITGTVTDDRGEPIVGIAVRLLRRTKGGIAPLTAVTGAFFSFTQPYVAVDTPVQTDDRGIYRFGGLVAGEYLVVASPPAISATRALIDDSGRGGSFGRPGDMLALYGLSPAAPDERESVTTVAPLQVGEAILSSGRGGYVVPPPVAGRIRIYPPTFYLNASSAAQATTISLANGEERSGIDIQLLPEFGARVAGTLFAPGGPASRVTLRLVAAGSEAAPVAAVAPTALTDSAGDFVFVTVPPGRYTLRGTMPQAEGSIRMPLVVTGNDIGGLTVNVTPPLRIAALLQFDGNTTPPMGADGRGPISMPAFLLDPADVISNPDQLTISMVGGNLGYVVTGYGPGRYRVRVLNAPAGWSFRAAMLNGVDVSETPFDFTKSIDGLSLVFTDRPTDISGVVQGGGDATTVLAFPTDASKWSGDGLAPRRFLAARADAQGRFDVRSLPAGDYYLIAVPEAQTDDWRDPPTLDALSRIATQATVLDGERKTVSLQLRQVRQ